jgi:hypothetical protein
MQAGQKNFLSATNACSRTPWVAAVIGLSLYLAVTPLAQGQLPVNHVDRFDNEDGDARYDADGAKNGVVVFKGGGTVHVIAAYSVPRGRKLVIESGAFVKVASYFWVDPNNGSLTWMPPSFGCGIDVSQASTAGSGDAAALVMDGGVLTDIRDDSKGGDTNQDGTATGPPRPGQSGWYNQNITLNFEGSPQCSITNSALEYVTLDNLGSSTIRDNIFHFFYGLKIATKFPSSGIPLIAGNTFEFVTYGRDYTFNQKGAAIIENNTFRYAQGGDVPTVNNSYNPALTIYGTEGISTIYHNTFYTGGGIAIVGSGTGKDKYQILDNTFDGEGSVGGQGWNALKLLTSDEVLVKDNIVKSYVNAIELTPSPAAPVRLVINANRFDNCKKATVTYPASSLDDLWHQGKYIDARDNYWGDPSGPFDNKDADGLYNLRGTGLEILQGISYIPFRGGTSEPPKNAIDITVTSAPIAPLPPDASVTFGVTVNYQLKSASSGKVYTNVRDKDGYVLNPSDPPVNVSADNQTTVTPPIQITTPELGDLVTVESQLVPDGTGEPATSNVVPFSVSAPPSAFTLLGIRNDIVGGTPLPIRGSTLKLKVDFRYTYAAGDVSVQLVAKERRMGNGEVIMASPSVTSTFPAATDRTDSMAYTVDIPLRDVTAYPQADLYIEMTMKTQGGTQIGKQGLAFRIEPAASIWFGIFAPALALPSEGRLLPLGRDFYRVGEYGGYGFSYSYNIKTPNVTDWQIWCGNDDAIDGSGKIIYQFTASKPLLTNASTGTQADIRAGVGSSTAEPPTTRIHRARLELRGAGNVLVAYATRDVEVREQPSESVQMDVAPGAQTVDFKSISARLRFDANQKAGTVFADQYSGQFDPSRSVVFLAKAGVPTPSTATSSEFYWEFIPINRYWAVYDTLQEGTFSATLGFIYDPLTDFPSVSGFSEDSLVIAGLNPMSNTLEALPTVLDKVTHSVTTPYTKFFDTWVVASKATRVSTTVPRGPTAEVPTSCRLEQNYPNPFNPTTRIRYTVGRVVVPSGALLSGVEPVESPQGSTLSPPEGRVERVEGPASSKVRLAVYDLLGRKVAVLVDEVKAPGSYEVRFDASALASGVYFYRMEAGSFVETKKLLLVR